MNENLAHYPLVTLLGPTASGKTHLAVRLAASMGAEIISGDSRQVYRGMDIGTGKDLNEYVLNGEAIPYHLIDIVEPGYKYNVYEFQRDFLKAYDDITGRGKPVVLCGGTGLYLESVLKEYKLLPVPVNDELRNSLEGKSLGELTEILAAYKTLHNKTDVDTVKRAVRAIEIEEYYRTHPQEHGEFPSMPNLVFGLKLDRDERRKRITGRLHERLHNGLIEEVRGLLDSGLTDKDLIYYGLEYKYVTLYLTTQMSYDDLFVQLETAIHQFAKRQMTWFRKDHRIKWLDMEELQGDVGAVSYILNILLDE